MILFITILKKVNFLSSYAIVVGPRRTVDLKKGLKPSSLNEVYLGTGSHFFKNKKQFLKTDNY